jgi:predicted metal-dependent hydrolase
VERKRAWITKHQGIAQKQVWAIKPKEFVNGEEFLYLGDSYRLSIVEKQDAPLLFDQAFFLSKEYLNQAKHIFLDWYKAQAKSKITERVSLYLTQAGLKYNRLGITKARKRWGSCGRNNNLNFSWRLIMAPLRIIDYVVAHEVAHLEHKNHSRRFWNKVASLFPEYRQSRKWLRENDHLLTMV